jgi:hypothetical protein
MIASLAQHWPRRWCDSRTVSGGRGGWKVISSFLLSITFSKTSVLRHQRIDQALDRYSTATHSSVGFNLCFSPAISAIKPGET